LVLTERKEHLDRFEQELAQRVDHVVVLRAGMGKKQRQAINQRLAATPRYEGRIVLATGKYVGEGFDDPRLDTLFLTLPVSWRGTVAQYAGRLHRLYDGKREVRIYDYADLNVPMLARMFDRRCRGYEAIGYTILLPASAIPGWPADVVIHPIPSGSAITPVAYEGLLETASTRRWRTCSCTLRAPCQKTPKVRRGPEVQPRRSSTGDWTR
jgi:hypothetical protein